MPDATNGGFGDAATPPSRGLVRRVQSRVDTPAVRTGVVLSSSVVGLGGSLESVAAQTAGNVSGVWAGRMVFEGGLGIALAVVARPAPSVRNPIGVKSQQLRRVSIAGGAASLCVADALLAAGGAHASTGGPGALALAGSVALVAGIVTGL